MVTFDKVEKLRELKVMGLLVTSAPRRRAANRKRASLLMTASGSKLRSNEVSISFTPVLYNSCSAFSIESQYWLVLLLLLPITLATTLYINSTPCQTTT
uniref:Uncharacterized protein n=1 Tax=Lotus japonicus TaxID=34305 RepID=I3S6X9_LOTJA|nr:unknown [Lotus japonicus]